MPRFHFHFRDGQNVVQDVDGAEFETFELAFAEAFHAAQKMWHDRVMRREGPRGAAFEITDGAGTTLATVPLVEVLGASRERRPAPSKHRPSLYIQIARARQLTREILHSLEQSAQTRMRSRELRGWY